MARKDVPLTVRERLAIWLLLYAIQIVHPYEYEHQFKEIESGLREIVKTPKKATNENL